MKRTVFAIVGMWMLWGTWGCANNSWNFWHPGSAPEQQRRAEHFDPYPQTDIAPQAAGIRPRDYDQPYPEAVRNQLENPPPRVACPPQQ